MAKQDVNAIVIRITKHRARQRQIPLKRRQINVYPGLKGDYWINRHEIKIKLSYALRGNPFDMIDPVLNAVIEFDTREFKEKVEGITRMKVSVMKWSAYLERVLSTQAYIDFIHSLLPKEEDHETKIP